MPTHGCSRILRPRSGSAPLADVPCLPELPRLIRLKYLTTVNRWILASIPPSDSSPFPPKAVWTAASSGERCSRTTRSQTWHRSSSDADTVAGVSSISGDAALDRDSRRRMRRSWRGLREAGHRCAPTMCGEHVQPVCRPGSRASALLVLVLSPELEVRAQTPETSEYLRVLVPPGADQRPIPAGAYNVGAQLLAVEAEIDAHPPTARRPSVFGGLADTSRGADRHVGAGHRAGHRRRDRHRLGGRADEPLRSRLRAERARVSVARDLITGFDTRRIAAQMFLSENTVQDHLKSIFSKTGTSNRRLLLARAGGH